MTNAIAGLFAVAAPVTPASAEQRLDDATGYVSFASLFAGATHALAQQPIRLLAKPEGTSELDTPNDPTDPNDADATGDSGGANDVDEPRVADATNAARPPIAHVDVVNGIDRSIGVLDPTLQEKLGRVISRMREETGRDVQVGETYRSQSRQNVLYAQGRSAPGPVVTWTRASKHTQGRAVDVVVDGGLAGRDAYATLRRIASEEGLRTLGERDPGHLELPTDLPRASATQIANAETFKRAVTNLPSNAIPVDESAATVEVSAAKAVAKAPLTAAVARVAPVASVASVATVSTQPVETKTAKPAEVARVATVIRSGVATSVMPVQSHKNVPIASTTSQQHATVVASDPATRSQGFNTSTEDRGQQSSNDRENTGYAAAYGVGRRAGSDFAVPNIVIAPSATTSPAHRAAQIIAAREDAPARPLSQIVMAVDAGNGTTDRIQLDLRGSALNATIDAGDQRAAHAMSAHKSELAHALTRDGVEVESIEVRAATAVAAPPVSAESAQRSSDSSSNSRFERGAQWQQQQSRQRSENERRQQQQRDERGGKK